MGVVLVTLKVIVPLEAPLFWTPNVYAFVVPEPARLVLMLKPHDELLITNIYTEPMSRRNDGLEVPLRFQVGGKEELE